VASRLVARKPLSAETPKLNEAIRLIDRFGGFTGRKDDRAWQEMPLAKG